MTRWDSAKLHRLVAAGAVALASPAWLGPSIAVAQESPPSTSESAPRGASGAIIKPAAPAEELLKAGEPTLPRPLNYVPPEYPAEAKDKGITGSVTLQLDVSRTGKLLGVTVIEPGGHGFDEAAVAAAKKLEFEPARRPDGTPFAARFLYRYSFTLKTVETPSAMGASPPNPAPTPGAEAQAPGTAARSPQAPTTLHFRGVVVVSSSGEGGKKTDIPIVGARVTLRGKGFEQTLTTGADGSFAFDRPKEVPAFTVIIDAASFVPLRVDEPGDAAEVKYRLSPAGGGLDVVVLGDRPPREVTKRTLEEREISRIPGTNGDALRSIQSLPGVARPPGLAGLLIVRGSAPQDTQTFIDGTPVPLIYHFGGLSSVVPTEVLEKIDFYPGNFSSQYGRVMGGIVDAGLRNPRGDDGQYHGLAQIDLIDARLLFEGPIPYTDNKWTFLAAGRRSWVDAWLGPVLTAAGAGVTQAPVYYDYQFMVANRPTPDSSVRIALFGSDDALKILVKEPSPGEPALAGNIGLHTAFQRLQVRYDKSFANGDKLRLLAAAGQDIVEFGLASLFFDLNTKTVTGRAEYSHRFSKGITLNTGIDMVGGNYAVDARLPPPPAPGAPPNQPFSTRASVDINSSGAFVTPAAYVEMELAPDARSRIVPGVRVDFNSLSSDLEVSPRVNGRYDIHPGFPRTTAKAGLGIFHQPPQPQETLAPLGNPKLSSNRAIHYELGVEQEITKRIEASLEGFYKQLDNLVVAGASPTGTIQYGNTGTGYVVGSELLLKYKPDERFFGWLAYTLSRSARTDAPGQAEHLYQYDQTHILTVLGSYRLGRGWEFGARFRLISGNLITPNVCDPSSSGCDPYRSNALFHAPSGVYVPIPVGATDSERLPIFHQLDLRIDKKWQYKRWALSTYLDVQNVYNHANTEAISYNYNYTARSYVAGLPILPSLGIRGEF